MQIAPAWTANRYSYTPRTIIGTAVIMGIVGNLKTMQLEELLQWLSQSKKNGTLQINNGKVEKKIFFKDGRIISSASPIAVRHSGPRWLTITRAIACRTRSGTSVGPGSRRRYPVEAMALGVSVVVIA